MPKLSIITINLNNLSGLQKTIESVFAQAFTDYEYIIIDGGSTDGSVDEIKKHENKLVYWVSEKDSGIYNAMNKGILKATGEYLMFLNSGDYLVDENTLKGFDGFDEDILCADIKILEQSHEWIKRMPEQLTFRYFIKDTLPHQSVLIKKSLLLKTGMYDESLKIVGDWKFYIDALCKHNASFRHIPFVSTVYINNGTSSRPENLPSLEQERVEVLKKEYPLFYPDYQDLLEYESIISLHQNSTVHKAANMVQKLWNSLIKRN